MGMAPGVEARPPAPKVGVGIAGRRSMLLPVEGWPATHLGPPFFPLPLGQRLQVKLSPGYSPAAWPWACHFPCLTLCVLDQR